jgi:hypothetical protein
MTEETQLVEQTQRLNVLEDSVTSPTSTDNGPTPSRTSTNFTVLPADPIPERKSTNFTVLPNGIALPEDTGNKFDTLAKVEKSYIAALKLQATSAEDHTYLAAYPNNSYSILW